MGRFGENLNTGRVVPAARLRGSAIPQTLIASNYPAAHYLRPLSSVENLSCIVEPQVTHLEQRDPRIELPPIYLILGFFVLTIKSI